MPVQAVTTARANTVAVLFEARFIYPKNADEATEMRIKLPNAGSAFGTLKSDERSEKEA
jgi:hypothetical protein